MKSYLTLVFGVLWLFFSFLMFSFGVNKFLRFSNKNKTKEVIGIIDSTFYQYTGGGGESYTIRVKYNVKDKIYFVYPNTAIYFEFENLLDKHINVIYLKNDPCISVINTFRERILFIIGAFFFIVIGVFIIIKSKGYIKLVRAPSRPRYSDSGNEGNCG